MFLPDINNHQASRPKRAAVLLYWADNVILDIKNKKRNEFCQVGYSTPAEEEWKEMETRMYTMNKEV